MHDGQTPAPAGAVPDLDAVYAEVETTERRVRILERAQADAHVLCAALRNIWDPCWLFGDGGGSSYDDEVRVITKHLVEIAEREQGYAELAASHRKYLDAASPRVGSPGAPKPLTATERAVEEILAELQGPRTK